MPSHPIDFQIQAGVYSTPELMTVFDETTRFQRWLDFEAALAFVQGEMGVIPAEAAAEINLKAVLDKFDLERLKAEYGQSRNSLIPVLKGLRSACKDKLGEFVHFGATTQDVLDTSMVLELQDVFRIVFRDLLKLEGMLIDLCLKHKLTPMVGRTHGQQALPVTLGLKISVWLAEVRRHLDRLKSLAPRVLIGQLSGAVGTMAALGPQARQVAERTLARLGLGYSEVSWHTSRDNIAETASFFAILTGTLEKIAGEVIHLGKSEIGELAEPAPQKAMSSSTMPHKRNPVISQRVAVLARHVRSLSGIVMESMVHEHERDARSLWSEWLAMPQISIYTGTCLAYLNGIVEGLEVYPERMLANLLLNKEGVLSEWLLFKFGETMGKMNAQKKLHDLYGQISEPGESLAGIIRNDTVLAPLFSDQDYDYIEHPERYIGQAAEIVDSVVNKVMEERDKEKKYNYELRITNYE